MIRIIYSYYRDANQRRAAEINACFGQIALCPGAGEMHILCEHEPPFVTPRTIIHPCEGRPKCRDLFNLIATASDQRDINIVLNSDCFPEPADLPMLEFLAADEAWCVSRVEISSAVPLKIDTRKNKRRARKHPFDMQDAWIIRGTPKEGMTLDFFMGMPGCDNRLAYELQQAGYRISNPASFFRLYHFHTSAERNYDESQRVAPPYAFPETREVPRETLRQVVPL